MTAVGLLNKTLNQTSVNKPKKPQFSSVRNMFDLDGLSKDKSTCWTLCHILFY